ncbi:hypothetical protein NIES21_28890 [Anabaenopsis circularis NIES-21]|uniref:Uncharacterized protein n=2 Tax=Nostocales TaxID=1161 RepID=A0A1Z4GHV3_9CYAN|nr:hypothetical protein NIES21_28890 [Anabaenopsis circularis NIES-21]GBE92005.1 probable Ribosome biogenesis protein YTM1 [Nostoc cycadae WK-1]
MSRVGIFSKTYINPEYSSECPPYKYLSFFNNQIMISIDAVGNFQNRVTNALHLGNQTKIATSESNITIA